MAMAVDVKLLDRNQLLASSWLQRAEPPEPPEWAPAAFSWRSWASMLWPSVETRA